MIGRTAKSTLMVLAVVASLVSACGTGSVGVGSANTGSTCDEAFAQAMAIDPGSDTVQQGRWHIRWMLVTRILGRCRAETPGCVRRARPGDDRCGAMCGIPRACQHPGVYGAQRLFIVSAS